MVAGAYATTRAVESGRTRWLALAGALIGFAFLTKMFQAFLVVPAFALVYLVAAPTPFRRRIWQLLVAGVALRRVERLVGGHRRADSCCQPPYIGGSNGNSIIDLIFGYNGLGRISGNESGAGGGGGARFSGATG